MSNTQNQNEEPDFDFWEFVACTRCHHPFLPESGGPPSVPFWITECGHVVCNNHLKPNKTCAKCGAQDIQVAPLQREMEAPMSNWFTSVPHAFDTVAFATRFQIETLASLVRYYKRKCSQHRALIERLKSDIAENKELKRTIEQLRMENEQLHQYRVEPSESMNSNGKRAMVDVHRHVNGARTNSSPRSVITPLGPNRLTLPPSHQQPGFPHRKQHSDDAQGMEEYMQTNRPGSRRFNIEQYAYASPHAQRTQLNSAPLSHAQAAPIRQASLRRQTHDKPQEQAHTSMMPPPPPINMSSRSAEPSFRPAAHPHPVRRGAGNAPNGPRMMPTLLQQPIARHPQQPGPFRPPPTPHDMPEARVSNSRRRVEPTLMNEDFAEGSLQSNRLLSTSNALPTQRFVPSTPSGHQRFSTPAPTAGPSHAGLMRTNTDLGSRAPSRAAGGGQRMPFIPGGQTGFG